MNKKLTPLTFFMDLWKEHHIYTSMRKRITLHAQAPISGMEGDIDRSLRNIHRITKTALMDIIK